MTDPYADLVPKRRTEDVAPGYADLIPEAVGRYADLIPEKRQTTSRLGGETPITWEGIKETPAALLRGAIKSLEGVANLLPDALNLALQSPEGLSPYRDPQLPTVDIPKPAEPTTEFGKTMELGAEIGTPFIPAGRAAKAARALQGALKTAPAAKVAPEITKALASAAERDAVYQRLLARGKVGQKAPEAAAAPPIQASEAATTAADALTPEMLSLRNARRALPEKSEGFSVNAFSANEAAKRTQLAILEAGKGFREARRSGQTFTEIKADADALGMSAEDLLRRQKGTTYNAAQSTAARQIAIDEADRLLSAVKIIDPASPEAPQAWRDMALRATATFEQSRAAISEGARALGAVRIELSPSKMRLKAVENITSGKFGVDPAEQLRMLQTLDDPVQVARFMRNLPEATTADKFKEAWINALLSGPVTHVKNFVSNGIVASISLPERTMAATLGLASKGEQVYFREVAAQASGMANAMKQATRTAWRVFVDEGAVGSSGKVELTHRAAIKGPLGYAVRMPGRALEASDQWFKAINYGGEIEALAVRRAIQEGATGSKVGSRMREILANPPGELVRAAQKQANIATFTNALSEQEGIVARGARAIQSLKQSGKELKNIPWPARVVNALGDATATIIFPFVRTPTNIFKYSVARSPFGVFLKDVQKELLAGGVQRQRALANMALGSAMGATTATYVLSGKITGAGPSDADERRLWRGTGRQPYSIKIGNKWYAYGGLEPFGTLLGISADFAEIGRKITADVRDKLASMVGMAFARNVKEKTFLQGMSQLVEALDDPGRYGQAFVQNLVGTAVPTGVAQTARAIDPVVRDVQGIMDRIKSRIPLASESVPPLLNLWGETITREGSATYRLFSPVYVSTQKNDPVTEEMLRLGVSQGMPERVIADQRLTAKQYATFVTAAGTEAKTMLNEEVASPGWKRMPDQDKVNLIEKIITRTRAAARKDLVLDNPALEAAYETKRSGE